MRQVIVKGELEDRSLRLPQPFQFPVQQQAVRQHLRRCVPCRCSGSGESSTAASTLRVSLIEAACASVMTFRVMPTIHAGSRAFPGSNADRERHTRMNTSCVASSAAALSRSERSARRHQGGELPVRLGQRGFVTGCEGFIKSRVPDGGRIERCQARLLPAAGDGERSVMNHAGTAVTITLSP